MAGRLFAEHTEAREHAHDTIERGCVRLGLGRDLFDRPRHAVHMVGNSEPGHTRQRKSNLLAK
jgi:hypothetical protein